MEKVNLAAEEDSAVDVSDTEGTAKVISINPEVEETKSRLLQKVVEMKEAGLELEERRRQWRALLREWHPDKHEDKELATAVFQFLQKAKAMLNLDGAK